MLQIEEDGFALDGEIIIPGGPFETLQLRLHPAASRIAMLSEQHPAQLVAFDLLARKGTALIGWPFAQRRAELEDLFGRPGLQNGVRLGKATRRLETARRWLGKAGLDGVVAKQIDAPYQPGARAMQKFKLWKTVDCVIGGLYRKSNSRSVESLLLGLYDEDGRLNYVGRTRIHLEGAEIAELVEPLVGGEGFVSVERELRLSPRGEIADPHSSNIPEGVGALNRDAQRSVRNWTPPETRLALTA